MNTTTFLELVKKRKSTRIYQEKPISREIIDQCLEAARLAPSACNSQPWSFIVIDEPAEIKKIARTAFAGIYATNKFASQAAVLIVVITEHSSSIARLGGMLRQVKYNLIDIGIACEHLILQATELGIGTCWLGWFNDKAVKKELDLPANTRIDILISMGYPQQNSEGKKIRRPLSDVRTFFRNSSCQENSPDDLEPS